MLRSEREKATLDELQKVIEWHDSVAGGLEAVRRLRELVPLLEEMRENRADWDEDGGFREELDRAIALAKGGEEKR